MGTKLTLDQKTSNIQCVRSWYSNVVTDSYVLCEEKFVKNGIRGMLQFGRLDDGVRCMP